MGEFPRDTGDTKQSAQLKLATTDQHPTHPIQWDTERSTVFRPMKEADAQSPDAPPPPGYLTVHYDAAKGLNKPVGPDIVHLTIDSQNGLSLDTKIIYGRDAQGRDIPPHYQTSMGEPGTPKNGQFDVSPNLQDITLHYTDQTGLVRNQTYPAAALRLEGDANLINHYVNDFRPPDQQRSVAQWIPLNNSVYEYCYKLSDIPGRTLGFMERQLVNDKAQDKTGNPFIDINLAETRVGLGIQHYANAFNPAYSPDIRAREKGYAMAEIDAARQNYMSAMDLAQKRMTALPNPGATTPHSYLDPLGRRFAPTPPYGQDYLPLVYGSAIDTANWRQMQLSIVQGIMSVNGRLPQRQSNRVDLP